MHRIIGIFILLFSIQSFGQDNYCQASVDKTVVSQNERFKYEIVTDMDCEISIPDFEGIGLKVVSGPIQGTSSSYTNINGRAKMVTEHSFAYYLIAPEKGNFVIPPAVVKCKKKEYKSEAIKITVGEGNAANNPDGSNSHFVKATVNKPNVYEGEAFTVTLKFYTKKRPKGINGVQIGGNTAMFRENLFKDKTSYDMSREMVDGQEFYVIELYKDVCIPLAAGTAELDSYYASIFYGGFFNEKSEEGYSNKVIQAVKELPKPKPENFNGLVGQFDMVHSINRTSLSVGQVLDLNISISGTGNFNSFDDPKFNFPDQFHVFDPEVTRDIHLTENGFTGTIDYHFVISPDEKGKYTLPPYSFSYFDPYSKTYKSLATEEFKIDVSEGAQTVFDDNRDHKDPTQDDIRYIQTGNFSYFDPSGFLYGRLLYWLLLIVPLLGSGIYIGIYLNKQNRSSDKIAQSKQKEVRRTVFKDFKNAKSLIAAGNETEALKSFQQSLINYFMVKLSLSMSSLSKNAIQSELEKKEVDQNVNQEFQALWDKIEMAQYSPEGSKNVSDLISQAEELIRKLNQKI